MKDPFGRQNDAARSLKRIERQMEVDGKFVKTDAVKGLAVVTAPVVFLVVGAFVYVLQALGVNDTVCVVLGVPVFLLVSVLVLSKANL